MTGHGPPAVDDQGPARDHHVRRGLRLRAWWHTARRLGVGRIVLVAGLALVVGVWVGRASAPVGDVDARRSIEVLVIPLVLDADGIWTSGSVERPPVSDALVQLRHEGDPSLAQAHLEDWLDAYDAVLVRLAGLDLPPNARPVQRQFIAAVTLSRDAVEVLGYAAEVGDPELRGQLVFEVGRLRQRAEQLTQAARASALDLDGQRSDVSPMPSLPGFGEMP